MRRILAFACLALSAQPVLGVLPERPAPIYREGELIVKYRDGALSPAAQRLKTAMGLVTLRPLLAGRAELLGLPRFTTTAAALEVLRRDPAVEIAEPNFRRHSRTVVPNDPLFSQQWGLRNTGQANFSPGGPAGIPGADLNLTQAWDADGNGAADRIGDPGVIVAIIDDAIEISHPDLSANVVAGYDFVCGDTDPSPVGADAVHGTLVTGCVAGKGSNGLGVAGVAWNTSIMALKFAYDIGSHLAALTFARDHGARIINASFGGPGFSAIEQSAIADLAADGILYVAAAGNDDSNTDVAQLNYPANYDADNIVAVAATNRQDNIASFSQYGPLTTDVAAPGLQIVTTTVGGTFATAPGVSGTSFSSPYTAGVAALIAAHVVPAPDFREIKARLIESGTAVSGANPQQRTTGGRVDADRALDMSDGPSLVVTAVAFDDSASDPSNDAMDPGETLDVAFTVRNLWQATGADVEATLSADNGVTVNTGTVTLAPMASLDQAVAQFSISVGPGITEHRYVTFTLTLTSGGYTATRTFLAEIGTLLDGPAITQAFSGDIYDEFHAWHVDVPAPLAPGNKTLIVRTHTAGGEDVDLLAKAGVPPQYSITVGINPEVSFGFFCTSGTTESCQDPDTLVSGRLDGTEAITVENPPAGVYHLVVVNFDQQAVDYTIETTLADGDLRPDPFTFTDRTGVARFTSVTSNEITVAGIDAPTFITVAGGEYSVDGGAFKTVEGTVSAGQTVRARANTGTSGFGRAQVTIGGVTETFFVNDPPNVPGGSADTSCAAASGGGGGGGRLSPALLLLLMVAARARRVLRRA